MFVCVNIYIYIHSNFIYIQNYSTVAISIPGPFKSFGKWAESPGLLQVLQGSGGATGGEIKMGRTGENYPKNAPLVV